MLRKYFPQIVLAMLSLQIFAAAQIISDNKASFTVPEAPWTLTLDGKNFAMSRHQIKPDGKSGYFLMYNDTEHITVSLFIEPAVKCKTSLECRDFVWKSGNPAWGDLQNVVQSKMDDVYYFEFFRPVIQEKPLQMFDMYAQFVQDGYWVDLHMSKVLYKKEEHTLFENIVKSAKFVAKTKTANANADKAAPVLDKSLETAQKIVENWMILWDGGEFDKSYDALASFTKESIPRKTWFDYWTAVRKPLGKLKSRKLVRADFIKSLPGVPNQSGAVFEYRSSFENGENVSEAFGLMLKKDGRWQMANYLTN